MSHRKRNQQTLRQARKVVTDHAGIAAPGHDRGVGPAPVFEKGPQRGITGTESNAGLNQRLLKNMQPAQPTTSQLVASGTKLW